MYKSQYNGIWFIEGDFKDAHIVQPIKVELNGMFANNQLKSLDDVKKEMAKMAISKQCNAIINFKYGQKSTFIGLAVVTWLK
jgi:uncharacterized membrane protein